MGRYIVTNPDKTGDLRGLWDVLPYRSKTGGTAPGMKNKEINGKESDTEISWKFPKKKPTEKQERMMAARVTEIGLRSVWGNFVYSFGGKYYLQQDGGPIGARVTMAASRIVMYDWSCHYRVILENICLWAPILRGYVDDNRQYNTRMYPGLRFDDTRKEFTMRPELVKADKENNDLKSVTKRMEIECRKAMNSINPDIQFTTETVYDFPKERLETLDTVIWIEEGGILRHSYFQKRMKTPYVIMQASAMASQQKFSILSNELMRRLGNTDHLVEHEEKIEIVEQFIKEMKNSGYDRKAAREAVMSGLRGLRKRKERREKEGGSFYRTAKETLPIRMRKKLLESTTWYREEEENEMVEEGNTEIRREFTESSWEAQTQDVKGKGGGPESRKIKSGRITKKGGGRGKKTQTKAVMFVPFTRGSQLAKKMRETEQLMEQMSGYTSKIAERGGTKLENILVKTTLSAM
jgi:hypothetical protein